MTHTHIGFVGGFFCGVLATFMLITLVGEYIRRNRPR